MTLHHNATRVASLRDSDGKREGYPSFEGGKQRMHLGASPENPYCKRPMADAFSGDGVGFRSVAQVSGANSRVLPSVLPFILEQDLELAPIRQRRYCVWDFPSRTSITQ